MTGTPFIKRRLFENQSSVVICLLLALLLMVNSVDCNRPPRFLIDGQTEIVLRLKEGEETPVGTLIYNLRATDPDGDPLKFGVRNQPGSDVIKITSISDSEANIYLNRELDREQRDEYALVLTLTDSHLGQGNYVTQSLLILVEDANDNVPVFTNYQSSIVLREDAAPGIIATLEASDLDEGAYGQVIYHLNEETALFSVSTVGKKAILRLNEALDYEKQTLHQLKVLAVDRAKEGRVNTGSAAILVKVEDVEDQPPEFVREPSLARIEENAPIGTSILQVTAIDGDRGVGNKIKYKLHSNVTDSFAIDQDTGLVTNRRNLDRESLESGTYILQITATEVDSKIEPAPETSTEVTIIVTDVNDETPLFKSSKFECEIAENAPVNTPVTFLGTSTPEVYDHDQGINGTFQLYIKGASDIFEITPTKASNEATFIIRVKNSSVLDYEKIRHMNFSLVAKEVVKHKPKFSEVPVVLNILDRNDNMPEFTKDYYEVFVPENCAVGTTVAWVQALDDDSGNFGTLGVRYTSLTGNFASYLDLNPISGVVVVKKSGGSNWDREQISRHYLTVEARDALGSGNRNTVQLIINLEDVNDNAPVFKQSRYEARLLENSLDFEQPLQIEARDADSNGTKNSEIEYSLFGLHSDNFTIHPASGTVTPRSGIDFELLPGSDLESVRLIHLSIRARDWGIPSLYTDVSLFIYVQDVNDYAPIFEHMFYNKSIPEDLPGGTSVLKIRAKDFDGSVPNNRVVYRIQEGAADKFVIGPESGIISVGQGAVLDPDLSQPKKLHYSLKVIALDGAPGQTQLQAAVTVNITILDVNNKKPNFQEHSHSVSIQENTPVGMVVTKIVAVDPDSSARLIYKLDANNCEAKSENGQLLLEFNCSEFFSLHKHSGILSLSKLLDREVVEIVKIGMIVEDTASENGIQIAKSSVSINIEDLNDNNPKFRKPFYKFAVSENSQSGITIGSVIADDSDKNKSISYSLEGPSDILDLITLNKDNGDIKVANKIDREVYDWLNFTVKASDSGVPMRHSRVEIFVQVVDENDNNPYFLPEPTLIKISEDTPVGREIAIIEARDPDSGDFGKITYLLDRMSSQNKFLIDPETGILKVGELLDREEKKSYLLIIEAWDNYHFGINTESRNAFKHLNVTILDVNDNSPKLLLPSNCINITEFHEPGQVITTFQASDSDDPNTSNGQVIIDISEGNEESFFILQQLNEWSAELRTTTSLRGKHGNYTLTVRAQDLGTPSHLMEEPLRICVTDFNDHRPEFISPPHNSTLKVPENATIGSALVQIRATDADFGLNGMIRYRLKVDPAGHWKHFNLQPVSGILELRLPLNRQKQKIFDIRIEAFDLGVPSLSSDLDLTVYVSNINDYRPQFLIDEFFVNFTENKQPNSERVKLPDTLDREELEYEGPPTPVCYFIVAGNEKSLFQLHPQEHILIARKSLDREQHENHLIVVKATEKCGVPPSNQTFFDPFDDTQLKVSIKVLDVNDNAPKFLHRVFTGGVSTATAFGTSFMQVKAEDLDSGRNAAISYYLIGRIQMTLTEGLDNLKRDPFLVEKETGLVQLNFDPQRGMKGYFDFMVLANDTAGLQDMARVFIYLLREDQRVRFVLRQNAPQLRDRIEVFREILGNVTGAIVNVDEFRVHANHDGTVDKTKTDLYLHLVDRRDNSIIEVEQVLRLVDQNTEKLDGLFKDFNVLDTQPGGAAALRSIQNTSTTFWLTASSLFLFLLLVLCLALCVNQRQTYHRKLKAATATAYIGADSDLDGRGLSAISGRVPNTNKHSMEGSNPIWLQAYENEWYKNGDEFSQNSDSLDENVVAGECARNQNVYQTLPVTPRRPLQTTEL